MRIAFTNASVQLNELIYCSFVSEYHYKGLSLHVLVNMSLKMGNLITKFFGQIGK